ERGAVAARRTAGAAARRADRSTRPGPASACLGDCRRAARGRRLRVLRDAEPRGARARRPRRGAARRARRRRDAGGGLPLNAVWLLLRKDLLVLRRSPVLLGALLAYPIVIALLVGLVAGYASSKPRVAFVDEDNVPPVVQVAGHSFHVQTIIDQVAKNVTLVR